MAEISVTKGGLEARSAEEVETELKGLGLHFTPLDVPPVKNDVHWHAFSSPFYLVSGELSLTNGETGDIFDAGPGDKISVPEGALHAENSETGYSILLGTTRDPATFEEPVNRPPETRPAS